MPRSTAPRRSARGGVAVILLLIAAVPVVFNQRTNGAELAGEILAAVRESDGAGNGRHDPDVARQG